MIRLLAIDIDGTLLDSGGRVPEAHRDALAEAARRRIALALVTGRSFHFTQPLARSLQLPLTLIVNNGAVVKDADGRTAMRRLLPRETARAILEGSRGYLDWDHPNRRGYYAKNKAFIAAASPLGDALTEDPIQVMFNGSVAPMRRLAAELKEMPIADRFSVALTEYELRDFALLDVNAAGCSKGTTLEAWSTAQGIAPAEVMAVGDNLNDLEMLEFAGIGVVMGNATDAMKSRGFPVTRSNDEGGLADAIVRYALSAASR
jgi:HAD superfamily hydrolase (TIGR01484 family)